MLQTTRHNRKTAYRLSGWLLLLAVFFAAAAFTGCEPALFFARKNHLSDLVSDMIRPDLSYLPKVLTHFFTPCRCLSAEPFSDQFWDF